MNKDKEVEVQRGRGGRFQRGRGRYYGEGGRYDSSMYDKGKSKWKNDDKGKKQMEKW